MDESNPSVVASLDHQPKMYETGNAASKSAFDHRIIVMARCPEAGRAKTRLIPALGSEGAALLHSCLVEHTLHTVRAFSKESGCGIDVQFAGGTTREMQGLFGEGLQYTPQQGETLGDRMNIAIEKAFADGCRRVVVIGTDCPQLQAIHLHNAFAALAETDVTIGPAIDGGYYLIGMREHISKVFDGIHWGTESVLQETLQRVSQLQKSKTLLTALSDVDYPEDLMICRQLPDAFSRAFPELQKGLLSIIIPTFNEEAGLDGLLKSLLAESHVEVIVVDGGSSDRTCQIAEQAGVRVIRCGKGRGRQMNAGAALARGEVLLFLHADSRLPQNFAQTIRECLESGYPAGAFRLRIDDPRWAYRLVEFGANLRSRWLQLPYGDQAMFVRAEIFCEMGGFQTWPLLEDFEFAERLRRRGTIMMASSSATVSARRWQRIGVLKATIINQIIIIGYRLGVSPAKLAMIYARAR